MGGSGCDQNVTCEFGIAHLPDDLNRMNFNMCELIEAGATQLMADIVADPSPWQSEYIEKCVAFAWVHRKFPLSAAVPALNSYEFFGDAVKDTSLDTRICDEWIILWCSAEPLRV